MPSPPPRKHNKRTSDLAFINRPPGPDFGRPVARKTHGASQELARWRARYRQAFPSFVFYLDALDRAREQELTEGILALGGSVSAFFSREVTHLVTSRDVPRPGMRAAKPQESQTWARSEEKPFILRSEEKALRRPALEEKERPVPAEKSAQCSQLALDEKTPGLGRIEKGSRQVLEEKPLNISLADQHTKPEKAVMLEERRGLSRHMLEDKPLATRQILQEKSVSAKTVALEPDRLTRESAAANTTAERPPKRRRVDDDDVVTKALEFGLKVWRVEKALQVVQKCAHIAATADANRSLPSLLKDESVFGTHERDPRARRSDMHYFAPKSLYLLVEDTIGHHRPIMAQEYARPRRNELPAWPVLWGGVEGRGAFSFHEAEPPERRVFYPKKAASSDDRVIPDVYGLLKKRALQAVAARAGGVGGSAGSGNARGLRRTVSLSQLRRVVPGGEREAEGDGISVTTRDDNPPMVSARTVHPTYIAASGNSQSITSNIASTTSTALNQRNGALFGIPAGRFGNQLMARRLVAVQQAKSAGFKRSVSVNTGLKAVAEAEAEQTQRENARKTAGYCENCRLKFDVFADHIQSTRHRKFALNEANWSRLDRLFARVSRTERTT